MKKNIAKQIRDWADSLPLVYEWEDDTITMSGWELNRTPYGENNRFNDDEYYCVPTVRMRAVMHEQPITGKPEFAAFAIFADLCVNNY